MYLSSQSLLVIVVVGVIAGWLAGKVVEGGGFGLIWAKFRCSSIDEPPVRSLFFDAVIE
jgi:hypothetical protein